MKEEKSDFFLLRCLRKTGDFMWQVTKIPEKISETLGLLIKYAQESTDIFLCVSG